MTHGEVLKKAFDSIRKDELVKPNWKCEDDKEDEKTVIVSCTERVNVGDKSFDVSLSCKTFDDEHSIICAVYACNDALLKILQSIDII